MPTAPGNVIIFAFGAEIPLVEAEETERERGMQKMSPRFFAPFFLTHGSARSPISASAAFRASIAVARNDRPRNYARVATWRLHNEIASPGRVQGKVHLGNGPERRLSPASNPREGIRASSDESGRREIAIAAR